MNLSRHAHYFGHNSVRGLSLFIKRRRAATVTLSPRCNCLSAVSLQLSVLMSGPFQLPCFRGDSDVINAWPPFPANELLSANKSCSTHMKKRQYQSG
jgi:hypothetical protein